MKPVIGITTPNRLYDFALMCIKSSVRLCGGIPKTLQKLESVQKENVDGLVLGGGTDVFPPLFQDVPKKDYLYDHNRDEMEIAWLRRAELENIPVLAICRGAQMMNIMHKGTLHLNTEDVYKNFRRPRSLFKKIFTRKRIHIQEGSLLHKILDRKTLKVNSIHSQSVKDPGEGIRVVAREDNEIVQAIEYPGRRFYIGVQFHPEFMIYRPSMRALFRGLINAAAANK